MRIALLGPLAVEDGDAPVEVRGARQQALLALLALNAGQVVPTARIVDELWGEDAPADPLNALQAVVSRLRKVLGSGVVVARGRGYALEVPGAAVDALRFEDAVERGRAAMVEGDADTARTLLRDALSLWRGPALPEVADAGFARAASSRLAELRGAALEGWADAELALGNHAALIHELRGVVEEEPLREGAWSRLMLALYRSGRQADALRAYQEARRALRDQLGVEPGPELRAMEAAVLDQAPSLSAPDAAGVPAAAPPEPSTSGAVRRPRSTFVGRAAEVAAVEEALERAPLVTLLGPGGVGKTRLASEIAAADAAAGRRVAFVDLAPVATDADVPEAFAAALGARDHVSISGGWHSPLERAASHLAGSSALVVVDNCEHVIDAAAAAADALLGAGRGLRLLATSREALGVPGEQLHPVPPLGPGDGVALFLDRARAVRPDLDPSPADLERIDEVCRQLDGLPLAIELAASRLRALPLTDLAARLGDRFRLLVGGARTAAPRQQTLRAVIDWSHELLTEEERHVFARLAALSGSFGLDAAAAVAGGGGVDARDVPDVVIRLVERSLVRPDADPGAGTARFRLLQTIWHYADEQLRSSGDADLVRGAHARHFTAVAEQLDAELRSGGQRGALDALEAEHDNLRAALEWAVGAEDRRVACRLVGALGWFWYLRGHVGEGARWATAALELPGEADPVPEAATARYAALLGLFAGLADLPTVDRVLDRARRTEDPDQLAEALTVTAALHPRTGDATSASDALGEADEIAARTGNRWLQGTVALLRAGLLGGHHDMVEANRVATRAVEHFRACHDDWGLSMALMTRALGLEAVGEYEAALADYTEAHGAADRLGSDELVQHFRIHSGSLRMLAGDAEGARRNHEEAVADARRIGSTGVLGMALNGLGLAARRQGDLAAAVAAHEEARHLYLSGAFYAGASLASAGLGFCGELAGDPTVAQRHHLEALDLARRTDDQRAIALACEGLAGVAAARGEHERAAELLGHAAGRRLAVGAPLPPGERVDVDRIEAATVAAIGRDRYEALAAAGTAADLASLLPR